MDYRLTDEDKERIKLLNEVYKNKFKNFSLEQLIRLQELLEKRDYSDQKRQINQRRNFLVKLTWKFTNVTMRLSGNNQIRYN
uniref:Uncharacterized protein n=1 Tax=uncultured marine thaumarchaeote AD1000_50_E11 TaxID=1455923 RepID=A0A075FTN8_9ARCH|nr:hypothetical protein [uncultured marine thaumarchaeote AD1000_50_E11]